MADSSRWLVGGLLVVVGLVLLGDNLGFYEVGDVWTYLPSVLVLWGVWSLVEHRLRRLFWPLLLVFVGVLWQLVELGQMTEAEAWSYWPGILVLLGLSMVFGRRRLLTERGGDSFELVSVTSHADVRPGGAVTQGEATAVFGSVVVDLRDEDVDTPVDVDAAAIFGDVAVRVPADWDVATEVVSIFGAVTDERGERPARTSRPDLRVSGVALFGDVTITD